ncbi:MAG: hypothetical protein JNK05_27305 [Myxococcales bacterium]|nr:hypothetical protein [Myxococcales bacterium]
MQKRLAALTAAGSLAFVSATMVAPREASAQAMPDPCVAAGGGTVCRTNASPQGVIGGALLGMELVMIIEGAAGVRNGWIMLGTGVAGGIAGGIGGFFLDQALDQMGQPQGMTTISTAMLAVGLGLVIPTAIVFTGATMYRPPEATQQQQDDTQGAALEEAGATNAGGASSGSGGATPAPSGGAGATSTSPTTGPTSSLYPSRRVRSAPGIARSSAAMRPSLVNFGSNGFSLGVPAVGLSTRTAVDGQSSASEWRVNLLSGTF